MCDTDYMDATPLRQRRVVIRKPQQCASCLRTQPVGASMDYQVSIQEREFTALYVCGVCNFLYQQEEHSDLHVCWGDLWEDAGVTSWPDAPSAWQRYHYVAYCIENNEVPTLTGFHGAVGQVRRARDNEFSNV